MKKSIRLFSLLLALFCVLATFAACNEGGNAEEESKIAENTPTSVTTEAESETEFLPDVEKQDYGEEFYLSIQAGGTNPIKYYWVEEGENDAMSEAIYARQMNVRNYLGVEIVGTEAGAYDQYTDSFKAAVKNKDGSVHTLQTHVYYGLVSMITENYLTDYRNMPGINLDMDYWNRDLMDSLAAGDRLYLGYCNYNLANTHVVTFNNNMNPVRTMRFERHNRISQGHKITVKYAFSLTV